MAGTCIHFKPPAERLEDALTDAVCEALNSGVSPEEILARIEFLTVNVLDAIAAMRRWEESQRDEFDWQQWADPAFPAETPVEWTKPAPGPGQSQHKRRNR
jgi:hypothetical protein